jgi:APA family basic amino acid/polyamine antiporter
MFELMFFGVGMIIGAGIFTIVGVAAREAGPALFLSFLISSSTCVFVALCYCELASNIPLSGSAFSYCHCIFGEGVAWMIGWLIMMEYCVSSAVVARSWSSYVASFFTSIGVKFPRWLVAISVSKLVVLDILALVVLLFMMFLVRNSIAKCWGPRSHTVFLTGATGGKEECGSYCRLGFFEAFDPVVLCHPWGIFF